MLSLLLSVISVDNYISCPVVSGSKKGIKS